MSTSRRTRPANQKSQRSAKRRKTSSIFLDIAAREGSNDDDDDNGDDDELPAVRVTAVRPVGHVSYAKDLDSIIEHYEDGRPRGLVGPYVDQSTIPSDLDLFPSTHSGQSIYVATFFTSKSLYVIVFHPHFLRSRQTAWQTSCTNISSIKGCRFGRCLS